jgi:type IV pilus assembly protein PilE
MRRRQAGFTLIELLITIIVIGILSAVAIPAYTSYVVRGRLTEAYTGLAAVQPRAEEFWSNNRTYAGMPMPAATPNFRYALSNATESSYTVTADGLGTTADFAFTIDQNGNRTTARKPADWVGGATCWIDRKSGKCVQ